MIGEIETVGIPIAVSSQSPALTNAAVQLAGDAGITRVYWVTDLGNDTAQRLYDTVARRANIMPYRISPKQ